MSISESCSCGASIELDRSDELALWKDWKANHKCRDRNEALFAISDSSQISQLPDVTSPELHLGFRRQGFDDE